MIERLDTNDRWVNTGWFSYKQLAESYRNTSSPTWKDETYIYIAVGDNVSVEVYRQPYLKAI